MKCYVVVVYRHQADDPTMAAYAQLALPAIMSFGGRFLVRASRDTVLARENGLCERVVLMEFPSREIALEAWDSPAYQAAYAILDGHVDRDVRFVEAPELMLPG